MPCLLRLLHRLRLWFRHGLQREVLRPNTLLKRGFKNVLGKAQAEVKEKLKKAIADSQRLDMNPATPIQRKAG